jgi:hypothetical protein
MVEVLYENARDPEIVVCESTGVWAARLKVALARCPVTIRQARSLDELAVHLSTGICALVAIEFRPSWLEEIVELLSRIRCDHQGTESVVLCRQGAGSDIWWLREAGATATVSRIEDVYPVTRLIRRHLRRFIAFDAARGPDVIQIRLPWV